MDGLEIGFGVGETQLQLVRLETTVKLMTMLIQLTQSYVYGPVTIAYQVSNKLILTLLQLSLMMNKLTGVFFTQLMMKCLFHTKIIDVMMTARLATDEEATGWSASYTVGSMTFKAHRNKGTNLGNAVTNESEHTEVGVTFAF